MWTNSSRPGTSQESALLKACALRDALSSVSARLRAAVEYAHAAARLVDDAMPAWRMTSVGKLVKKLIVQQHENLFLQI